MARLGSARLGSPPLTVNTSDMGVVPPSRSARLPLTSLSTATCARADPHQLLRNHAGKELNLARDGTRLFERSSELRPCVLKSFPTGEKFRPRAHAGERERDRESETERESGVGATESISSKWLLATIIVVEFSTKTVESYTFVLFS